MVVLAVAMGLGRFAFTPMLPIMLAEGHVDLETGGALASSNYLGYFIGALSCMALRMQPATAIRIGLVGTAALLTSMGIWHGVLAMSAIRLTAGVMSAWAFVFASGWGLRRLAETNAPALAGVIYCGPGIGIVISGLLGGVIGHWGSDAGWIGYGVVAAVLIALVWRVFDDAVPVADGSPPAVRLESKAARADAKAVDPAQTSATIFDPLNPDGAAGHAEMQASRDAKWLVALYPLAGFGYIITATFLPIIARQSMPDSTWADLFWPLFGLATIPGALIGARAPTHWDNRLLLAGAYALQAAGIVLTVVWPTLTGFALGSLLLGGPFTALTLFVFREARRLRGNAASGLIGLATAIYGIGQIVGPLFAAPLALRTGSFSAPLLVAAAVLVLGSLLFLWIWRRSQTPNP